MIDVDVSTVELVETTGFGLLCQSCQEEVKINQRNKKLNKVLNKGLIQRIKEWLKS
jgi:ABC-type transporter Mla MlaB component